MNRAERRKQKLHNSEPIITLKRSDLEKKLQEMYQKGYEDGLKQSQVDASGKVFAMLLGLPCKVLKEHFNFSFKTRLPKFADILLAEYQKFDETTGSIQELQELIYEQTGIIFNQDGD